MFSPLSLAEAPTPAPVPTESAAPPQADLPDPRTTHQLPPPVPEPPPRVRTWRVEVGVSSGVAVRPADGDGVHSKPGFTIGGHARVRIFPWLAVRLLGRTENSPYTYDDRALGLPSGTRIDQPSPTRIYLSADVEPTWSPVARLDLWAGVGIGWGRSLASTLNTSGAETVNLPERAAVIVDVPLSLGARYEIVPEWLVVNLSATVAFPIDQSGTLLEPYSTPWSDGRLHDPVGGFPKVGTTFIALAGLGVLL